MSYNESSKLGVEMVLPMVKHSVKGRRLAPCGWHPRVGAFELVLLVAFSWGNLKETHQLGGFHLLFGASPFSLGFEARSSKKKRLQ